ncbi:DUF5011 domain-containing protein [Polaribacter sp.]|nr:DUF5011 domain-containing protein [Polaribacter sp.]
MNKVSKVFVIFCVLIINQSFAINSKEKKFDLAAKATDLAKNTTEETFATGANKLINNSPTASLVHTVAGNVVDLVRENDEVTLTATFDHDINSDFTMLIYGEGAQDFNGGMTRISSTEYTYTYTVDSGSGVQNFYFDNGQDLEGNLVTPDPSSGASIYHNPSVLNYSYEDFQLNNPNAVKINIIYLTNDINLITLPVDSNGEEWGMAQVEELVTESNTAFNELYDASNWPGFELGRITKAYNLTHHNTSNPHGVLYDISTQPVAQKDYLNIVIVTVNRQESNVAGTTFQGASTRGPNGATLVLSSVDEGYVTTHEMGHVIGLPHLQGDSWPPYHMNFDFQDGSTMGFSTLNHSRPEGHYLGTWKSDSFDVLTDLSGLFAQNVSLYLSKATTTFKTPTFGALSSKLFRSWLITNEYISDSSPDTNYIGHDTSISIASDWESEGINEFSSLSTQTFPKIVTSQNENNNYAAVSFLNETTSQLSYSYRDNNSVWGPVTTIQGVDGEFNASEMAMNSIGDVIIITENWQADISGGTDGSIKVFSKNIDDASWTNSLVISDPVSGDLRNNRAKVSINNTGNSVAVWLQRDNDNSNIIFKERVAGTWSSATVLSLDGSKNELPSIAYNNNGDVLVSWQQWNTSTHQYEVVGKFRNGVTNNWSSLESYGNPDSAAGFSQVALDADGNALVYWRQAGFPQDVNEYIPKPRTAYLNVRYRNFNGTLEETVQLTPTEEDAFNGVTEQNENRVVFLEDGTAAVTWWVNDGTNPSTIYSSAMPSKNIWTTPVALSNSGHNATLSKITTGNEGDYSVIWQRPDGLNTRIQTRTYHASTSNWSAISTLSDSNNDAIWGDIASDGDNQLSAIWVRNDGTKLIPEVKRFSLNPFITETTITPDNSSISVSFNEAVYNAIGATGALEANDFTLSITGGTATLASTTPTSISNNENTYTLGVSFTGIPDGTETLTVVPADSGVIFDSGDNAASTSQNNNSVALNDKTSHTASLVYKINSSSVSSVTEGDEVLITATFNQEIEDNPIVQISGSGVNSISASNMTKVNNKEYTYSWTVTTGSGVQNFELETGINSEGTVIAATPSSGATIIVVNNISPTATFNYTIATPIGPQNAESSVNAAKENDVVTITALFSEDMADFPSVQISGTGMETFNPINMTKVSSTEYTFNWRAVSGDGIQNFTLGTGKDLSGDVITPTPSSGASIIIDNTQPTVGLVYTIDGTEVSTVKELDEVLITATFNEAISDDGIKINGYGSTTVPFSDMTKVSTTEYTYLWTVGFGQGNTDFGLGYGTDTVGNEITNDYMTGRSILVDNSSPTALIDWEGVTTLAPGEVVTVYITFSEEMANSPVPKIFGSGANTIAPTDLVQHYLSTYKYIWTVGENTGTQTFSVSTGTDLAGNVVEETLTSGGSILIDILPTAALSYTISGTAVSSTVKQGDEVLITAAFNKDMADSPVVQIYAEGQNEMSPSDMTKINSTSYTYILTVGSGNGNQYFRMATGTDLAGTIIETYPTYGETLIIDNTPPTITLLGDPIVNIEVGATYTDAGADADDNVDGPVITDNIVAVSTVNTSVIGNYTVTYNVSDAAGNAATQVTRTVNVTADETIPVITLSGVNPQSIELGTAYSELGATATDNIDGDISANISIDATYVDINTVGDYTVTYNVSDTAGNPATQVTRTVTITPDTTIPVIILVGANPQSIVLGNAYSELGASATDNTDGDISANISIDATAVNVNTVGNYTVTYNVSDAAGNPATQVTRTVNVTADADSTIPVITLVGANPQIIELGTAYSELGATATDNIDGDISANISIDATYVDINTVGDYTVTYNVSDTAGNPATQVTRTVTITPDTTIPVITLVGANPQSIELGTAYSELGASATDNIDGDISASVVIVATDVDINTEGDYTVTYNVSDAAGNPADEVTRTVTITPDATIPVITLVGANPQSIELGTAYNELGAAAIDNIDGNITESIVINASDVDVNALGDYTVTYNVSDTEGNIAEEVTRIVNVVDTSEPVSPVIILLGSASVYVELGTDYTDAGATASDGLGGNITSSIVVTGTVDNNNVGDYTISYNVDDAQGNTATQVTRTVSVVNYSVPVITLLGDAIISLQKGAPYFDEGATALDNTDGDITNHINIVNPVNINAWGTYTITYNVSNSAGIPAIEVTRTVVIPEEPCDFSEDFEVFPPENWTILNSNTQSNDITQTDITSKDGSYSLRFSSKDVDSSYDQYLVSPAFTPSDIEREISFYYLASELDEEEVFKVGWSTTGNNLENDFTWSDEIIAQSAQDLNDMYLYSKDDLPIGTKYVAIHYYSDNKNHLYIDRLCLHSTPVGSFNPGITLIGAEEVSIKLGSTYTDAGAIAFSEDGVNITANIVTVNPVDENSEGTYTITYNVSDSDGNQATEVTRIVTVFTSMWNGSVNNDWDTAANWSSNSVPGPTASVRIPKTGITNFPTASNAVTLNAVTIESGASLIAESTFSGSLTYKRKLHLANDWNFISSPVAGVEVGQVLSTTDVQTGSGMHLGLSYYDNSIPGWEYFTTISSGIMGSGDGFAVLVNSGDVFFTGTMPVGPIDKSLTQGIDGWNLIGNPYPSYLAINNSADATNFLDANSSNISSNYSGIYLWDVANQNSSIKVVNQATDSYDMAPGQGFFVNVNSDGNSVSFTKEMQSHQTTEIFYRTTEPTPTIVLELENNGDVKTTTIKYFDTTTAGLDIGYDAGAFNAGGESDFKLNTHLLEDSEGIDFMLQCLSTNEYETSVVPVALKAEAGFEILFSVETSNLPEGIKVFLEDKTTNTYTRLDEVNSEYMVTLTEAENGIGRFYLHTKSSVLNTNDIHLNTISIYKKNSSTIRIVGLGESTTNFKLFNVLGVLVKNITFTADRVLDIGIPRLPAGIYIVQLENEYGIVNKKLFLD